MVIYIILVLLERWDILKKYFKWFGIFLDIDKYYVC